MIPSAKNPGHLRIFSTLLIGHKKYAGEQRVSCWPFKTKQLQLSNRQDMVFVRPPGIPKGAFRLSMDSVWFCKVLFLFRSYLHMIREESSTTAPSSQSSRNTRDEGDQVAYNAYFVYICIFYKNLHISSLYAYFLTWPVELCRMARQGELEDGL